MFIIDTLAYTNRLRATHPGEKILFALCTLLGVLLTDSAWILAAITFGMMLFTLIKIGITPCIYGRLLLIPAIFILTGMIPLLIEIGRPTGATLLSIHAGGRWLRVTPATVQQGGRLALKSLASISCFYVLILSTPMNDVLYAVGKIGVPPIVVEMMSLMYRYISIFMETARQMYLSQRNRLGYCSFKKAFLSLGMLASTVFIHSFLKSSMAHDALLSRCYRGEIVTLKEMRPVNGRALARIFCFELLFYALIAWCHR